jgi:hypothetical protein
MLKILRKPLPVAALVSSSSLVFLTYAFIHFKIEHRLAPEHLERAKIACGYGPGCTNVKGAMQELAAIPRDAPEQAEAIRLWWRIEDQRFGEMEYQFPRHQIDNPFLRDRGIELLRERDRRSTSSAFRCSDFV